MSSTHEKNEDWTVYRLPDPRKVAFIIDEYGFEAAFERWGFMSDTKIRHLGAEGRRLMAVEGKRRAA